MVSTQMNWNKGTQEANTYKDRYKKVGVAGAKWD
jgi:hypothetical protein